MPGIAISVAAGRPSGALRVDMEKLLIDVFDLEGRVVDLILDRVAAGDQSSSCRRRGRLSAAVRPIDRSPARAVDNGRFWLASERGEGSDQQKDERDNATGRAARSSVRACLGSGCERFERESFRPARSILTAKARDRLFIEPRAGRQASPGGRRDSLTELW